MIPPEIATLVMEQYGPIGLAVIALWYRFNKLEKRIENKFEKHEKAIKKNANKIKKRINSYGD